MTPRRPLEEWEIPHLKELGQELRDLREDNGFSRPFVGYRAELSPAHLRDLECGLYRTRRSTLERLAKVLFPAEHAATEQGPSAQQVQALVDRLCELAGPALAPESEYADRIARRRVRRRRNRE